MTLTPEQITEKRTEAESASDYPDARGYWASEYLEVLTAYEEVVAERDELKQQNDEYTDILQELWALFGYDANREDRALIEVVKAAQERSRVLERLLRNCTNGLFLMIDGQPVNAFNPFDTIAELQDTVKKCNAGLNPPQAKEPEPQEPRCPSCGYTAEDARYHGDHRLCKNSGNTPWEKSEEQ